MTIASPCIRQCTLDAQRICQGCHRTLDEIAAWSFASDHEKLAMLAGWALPCTPPTTNTT